MANKTATLKNQAGDNIYPNIVGDNRNAAIKDSTTIKHTLVDNKISLDLDEAIKEKINAAAGGGKSVSPTLNLIDFENGEVRTSITEEEYNNLKNGLYNSINYYTEEEYDTYLPSKLISAYDDNDESLTCIFSSIKITATSETDISTTNIIYQLNIGQKDTSGNYPITIEKEIEIPFGSSSGGGGGSSIPVVEGTETEPTAEEKKAGITKKYTIPTAQTSPFILHSNDIGYMLVDIFADESVAYGGITAIDRNNWALISGNNTIVYISAYRPISFYSTDFFGYFPYDETTSVDITFPLTDRIINPACIVSDVDVSQVFVKSGNSIWGTFQTPITYCNDGKYRFWYIDGKDGDTTNKLATVKCKVVNMGGPATTITFED